MRHRCGGGVVGCSGNNAAPSGPAELGPTEPAEPMDRAPDEKTPADEDFDEAYRKAEGALNNAVEAVEMAKALADAAATAEEREKAREALSDAQGDLAAALKVARELPVPTGDELRRDQAAGLVSRAEAAQASTQWSAGESRVRLPVPAALPEIRAVRRIRTNPDDDNADHPDLLRATSFLAVPYEPGKFLISEGEASSGDLLFMRGYGTDQIKDPSGQLDLNFSYSGGFSSTDAGFVGGIRITPTGLVMQIGGRGGEGMDMRRRVGIAPPSGTGPSTPDYSDDPPAVDPHGWDLTLTFGEPTSSPEGNGERYWAARLMPDSSQTADGADADTRAKFLVDGRPYQIGMYKLWLSNHSGVELGLEPAEGGSRPGETYPEDDENSYLKYAAYGMLIFESSDRFSRSTGQTGAGWREIRDRVNSFHLGYDAFEDKSGKRTTDIGEAVSKAKFTGLTIALELDGIARGFIAESTTAIDMRAARRLRGDIELTATISGTASDNNIEGRIKNLEVWDSRGYWKDYATITGEIKFGSASIGADGGYWGFIAGITGAVGVFSGGLYHGSFYGPDSGLETAGVWYLSGSQSGVHKGFMGSFGAKHAPPSE